MDARKWRTNTVWRTGGTGIRLPCHLFVPWLYVRRIPGDVYKFITLMEGCDCKFYSNLFSRVGFFCQRCMEKKPTPAVESVGLIYNV